ncbi:MAG TPA: 3-oxoacyl-ACP reductase FabG [bacterium]|jgi:3-oxoacyl-[acyl-carrier protein] reductase|nr:3-oxoacyl-ACP reductase FabG [bacterium]
MEKPAALVTGASRGIGRAIALSLAKDGFHVVINCRKSSAASDEALEAIHKAGGSAELLCFDVADKGSGAIVAAWMEAHGPFYILVNNAGIHSDALLVWMKQEDWQSVLDTNLTGFYNVTRPVVKEMMQKRKGRIVNIVSTSGQTGVGGQVNYSASKAGLIGATKSLAAEIGKRGITVNAVSPGFIETAMLDGLPLDKLVENIPLGRLGKPEEVAAVVSFLCSPMAGYITGGVIPVNGGIYL